MKKLRRKFVLAVFASATVVFALTVFFTFVAAGVSNIRRADEMTKLIYENGGQFLPGSGMAKSRSSLFGFGYNEESPYRLRFAIVSYRDGTVSGVDVSHIVSLNEGEASEMAETVRGYKRSVGFFGEYRYRSAEDSVILLDCSDELDNTRSLVTISSLVSLLFVLLITIVFYLFSGKVLRPFEENARMQRRFITDASHELKTPLAIISANAEVLAYKSGGNEWVGNITAQVERMSGLINEMLTLSRLEEIETISELAPVDMSELTRSVASEFEEVFRSKNVRLAYEIKPDIVMNGDEAQLRRLVSVLVDNAAKYVPDGGTVGVDLKKDSRRVHLSVFNTCELDKTADLSHLFDRFYRPDASRTSKTGGHGIGLSIAKQIALLHNGTIEARPSGDGIEFRVALSPKLKAGKNSKRTEA